MSTKIYDAYRIKKDVNILDILKQIKEISIKIISNNHGLLKTIHVRTLYDAKKEITNNNPSNYNAKHCLEKHKKNDIDIFWIEKCLEKYKTSLKTDPCDIFFNCSILYDNDYWYVKFFSNYNWQYDVINESIKLGLEDYHYQNSTDPPENVSEENFYKRGDKWEELLNDDYNYRNSFQYNLFDPIEFKNLLSKNYYLGLKTNEELYSHLAYKFDDIKFREEKLKNILKS